MTEVALIDQKRLAALIAGLAEIPEQAGPTHFSAEDLEVRMELMESYWETFSERDLELRRSAEKLADRSYFKSKVFEDTIGRYINAKAAFRIKIREIRPSQPLSQSQPGSGRTSSIAFSSTQAALEKLKLPQFDGNPRDWEQFKEKFTSLVLNDQHMDPVIKIQHLCNCLDGEAAEKLKGVSLKGPNFVNAWDTLCKRYDNKFLRFSLQMDALVNLPSATHESVQHLSQLLNTVNECITTFESLSRPVSQWDDVLVYFVDSKLADNTRMDWAKVVEAGKTKDFPTYQEIRTFLEDRINTLDVVESRKRGAKPKEPNKASDSSRAFSSKGESKGQQQQKKGKNVSVNVVSKKSERKYAKSPCSFCNGDHFIGFCSKFSACSQDQRRKHVSSEKLCGNCLNAGHQTDDCSSKGRCLVCGSKHNTKLHQDVSVNLMVTPVPANAEGCATDAQPSQESVTSMTASSGREILLATAYVTLQAPNGQLMEVRALLDSGAQASFLSERVVQALGLTKLPADVTVSGVGGNPTALVKNKVQATLKSKLDTKFEFHLSALVLKRLTAIIPCPSVPEHHWPHLEGLRMADPCFQTPGRIDCILGSEAYAAVIQPGLRRGRQGSPIGLQSVFGWVLLGPADIQPEGKPTMVCHVTTNSELSSIVARFWEHEEVSAPAEITYTPEEKYAYDYFRETTYRNPEGRFVVRLPFSGQPEFVATKSIAENCLKRLHRRFTKNPELASAYKSFMQEYLDLHHMEVVSSNEVNRINTYYLPHHPVFKNDDSKKLRVVFNASQKDVKGNSLNSILHSGPNLQEEALIILIRWAFYRYAFTCDIEKMFRQYLLHPEDTDWQRIVWSEPLEEIILVIRLLTVTYGTACASFLANACLLLLADQEQRHYPRASKALRKNRYVDDFFVGGDSLEEAIIVRIQLVKILASAGMRLGKWAANDPGLLEERGQNTEILHKIIEQKETVSTLGLRWLALEDTFYFKISTQNESDDVTKRSILSEISRLFDPVGWLCPIIIQAKIMLQGLWMEGMDWDEPVSEGLKHRWNTFKVQLKEIEEIRIPRWLGTSRAVEWHLHCFCDASEKAYAAAVYAVTYSGPGNSSKIITAKSKVAPIKVLSLPRLELSGALLLARMTANLLPKLEHQPTEVHCWSDSQVVLAWLRDLPSRWKTFVANRTSEIRTLLPSAKWKHVRSADNPADLASRGCSPAHLRSSTLWWNGPSWLLGPRSEWPATKSEPKTDLEVRKHTTVNLATQDDDELIEWTHRFSSVDKIIRILAYIQRWKENVKNKERRQINWLRAGELAAGHGSLMKIVQRSAFKSEFATLVQGKTLPSSSCISRLSPYIGPDGLIRVGGRLQNAHLSEGEKHPIILPGKNHITLLLIRRAHFMTMHGGPTLVQSYLSRRYWLVRARNVVRGVVRRCVRCARYRATTLSQQMAPLPEVRTRPTRPFTYTGVDFAGPFAVRTSKGRGQKTSKSYVAVFVCLVVRAIHLEVVSDLTSAAFLAAFRRFTARRGWCKVIHCDNGTTFKGADAELRRLWTKTSEVSKEVAATVAKDGVEWTYIPPRAPNFGGLWEASVKSFKMHLKRVVGEAKLTFEEFYTVACMIEACLNSRPLSLQSSSEEDVAPLTPGHFLIGDSMTALPEPFQATNQVNSVRSRWHLLTLMRNHFWQRWSKEFLAQVQQRSKWLHPNHTFKEGDVVLFKDELLPPGKWPLARITRTHLGPDGLCRVVTLKTPTSEFKRPVNKIILLPVSDEASSHLGFCNESLKEH